MTLTITTPETTAVATLTDELAQLEGRREFLESRALAGDVSASQLATYNDDVNLLRARVTAAERAATRTRSALAEADDIRAAVIEFQADESISAAHLVDGAVAIKAAADDFRRLVDNHNARLKAWVDRFKALGVPASGLEVDGQEIAYRGNQALEIGGAGVSIAEPINDFVLGAVKLYRGGHPTPRDAASLSSFDTRDLVVKHVAVTLTEAIGGHKAGDQLSTRTGHVSSALLGLVDSGHAELDEA